MSLDLVSVISKCINDFEEKHCPIVCAYGEYHEIIIELVRGDRYKWTEIDFDTPRNTTRKIEKQTTNYITRKGLIMYFKKDINEHFGDFEISCSGRCFKTIIKTDYTDDYEDVSQEFNDACIESLEWFFEFQKECFE